MAGRKAKERVEGNGREEMKKCEGQEKKPRRRKVAKKKESSRDSDEVIEDEVSDSDRDDSEVAEEQPKVTLAAILDRKPPVQRVWSCPPWDAKLLSVGKLVVRKYEEGWSVGQITQYRPKKVRSNCELEHENELGCKRNEMLSHHQYFTGKDETIATDGSWFF